MTQPRVLVIDDSLEMAKTVADYLSDHGFEADAAGSGRDGLRRFEVAPPDAVLVDLRMEEVDGLEVLRRVRELDPEVPVVIMTAFGAIETAVEAIRRGAYHYVTKPFKLDVVRLLLDRACEERALRLENRRLRSVVERRFTFGAIVGRSQAMRDVFALVERVAQVASPALVLGETGTGKELVARALHQAGPRAAAPFVAVNCAALPETLLESELFGHARGAFTGATQMRRGLFVEADGGTLLLDEIGDMPLALQAKLLRVIESGEVRPLGSDASRATDVRIVASTHRDLAERVARGEFREDLYFRLKVLPIRLPPLRERREDIPLLLDHFLAAARATLPSSPVRGFSPEAARLLTEHPWPGNVRELENVVERLVVTGTRADVGADEVRAVLDPAVPGADHPIERARRELLSLREVEQAYIDWILDRVGGNKTRAAEILGIDPSTLYRREKARG